MSTSASRQYNFVDDKNAAIPPTASRVDAELDNCITKLNQKVIISASAPSSPIAGMFWLDSSNKVLKQYRNSEWVLMGPVHYGASAPSTMQFGDVWIDSSGSEAILKVRNKANGAWLEVATVASPAQGDVLYRDASAWANLAAGTAGMFLKTLGAAANPAWAYAPIFKIGADDRNETTASGTQAVTGTGFTPRFVFFFGANPTSQRHFFGMSDGTSQVSIYTFDSTQYMNHTVAACIRTNEATNYNTATLTSFDANGFTLTWVKTGSPTGTMRFMWLAIQ